MTLLCYTHFYSPNHILEIIWSFVTTWLNHLPFFPFTGLGLPPAFPAMVDNHVGHNSSMAYMGGMEPKPAYPPPQVTPSRYSPVPRHMLGEEDFTRSESWIYSSIHSQSLTSSLQGSHDHGKIKDIFAVNIYIFLNIKYLTSDKLWPSQW